MGFFIVTLYITRHGQTEWNVQKKMQGWLDSPLTENGRNAASSLGKRLQKIPFKAAYVSPSGRTLDTARLICSTHQIPLFIKEQLREINAGKWQGMSTLEIKKHYPEQYIDYYNDPLNYLSVGGENFHDIAKRVTPLIDDLCSTYEEEDSILIVTHAVVKKLLISLFNETGIENIWSPPFIHGTSLTIVHINKVGEVKIHVVGDTTHLEVPL